MSFLPRSRGQPVVTTSWDDGHVLDSRLAEMLADRGLQGTFYVAPESVEIPTSQRLSRDALREIGGRFELGGHTLTHRRLTELAPEAAESEIRNGKTVLEDIGGRPVSSFCYPGGAYRSEHVAMVQSAGFRCARTVRRGSIGPPVDPYSLPTTVQALRHKRDLPKIAALLRFRPVATARCAGDWARLAKSLFDIVLTKGGVFHLWGHSWEIDRLEQWERLTSVLDHIAGHPNVLYVSNGELFPQQRSESRQT